MPGRALLARLAKHPRWWALIVAFGLGLLSAMALPPVHAAPVLLLAVPGLLALLGAAGSWRGAAARGFAWGSGSVSLEAPPRFGATAI